MTAVLAATPSPLAPSAILTVVGSGFANERTRLRMNNLIVSGTFRPTGGVFSVKVTVPATSGIHNLVSQQRPGHTWLQVASPVPIVVQTAAPVPKIVGNPVVDPVDDTSATISWSLDQPSTGQIEYGPATSPQTYPLLTTLEPNLYPAHSQALTGLAAGTPYRYRLRSGNANGSVALVDRGFSTLAATPTLAAPGAPTGLVAVPGDTTVDLAWVTPASDGNSAISGYRIREAGVVIATVGVVNVFHRVGRTNGVTYVYTVAAINAIGEGTASGSASATPASSGVSFPPDTNPLVYRATPVLAVPAYLAAVVDATWQTHVKRVSDIRGVRGAYSRYQPWSKDGDFIMLPFTGAGQTARLINGTTYADIGTFSPPAMAVWANTVNDRIFGVTGNQLIRKTMAGTTTVVHTFNGSGGETAFSAISLGEYEGGISDDDSTVALIGTASGGILHLVTFDIPGNSVIADIVAPAGISDCQISRSGTYVTLACSAGIVRYLRNLTSPITLQAHYSHGDNALDASGNEIFVANNGADAFGNQPTAYRLSTGAATRLLTGSILDAAHVSGHHGRNGWVVLSNYDPSHYNNASNTLPGKDQVVAVKTDGSGTVEPFAQAHHARPLEGTYNAMSGTDKDKIYAQEPHAAASRDGSRVLFASEWSSGPTAWSLTAPYAFVAYA